jgi:hypothetical protein
MGLEYQIHRLMTVLLMVLCCVSCTSTPSVARLPEIGGALPLEARDRGVHILVDSNIGNASYSLRCDGIDFVVCTNTVGIVSYIQTYSKKFMTPEGVHVGMTYGEVTATAENKIRHHLGWGVVVPLPSGWNAGFAEMPGVDTDEIPAGHLVEWVFKR